MPSRALPIALVTLGLTAVAGCGGPSVPSIVGGETVCADYKLGGTTMRGGLRKPVQVTVKDGDSKVASALLIGLRASDAVKTHISLPDSNDEYTVEWAQCSNERATGSVDRDVPDRTKFACGDAAVYNTETVTTKRGEVKDAEVLHMPEPPAPECWKGD